MKKTMKMKMKMKMRKRIALVLAAALSLTALLATTASTNYAAYAADNLDIEVPFTTYTLAQGETKFWEVPLRYALLKPKLDLVYVIDTTGSMSGIRGTLAETLAWFTEQLVAAGATDINFGAAFFGDKDYDSPWYEMELPLGAHNLADVQSALRSLHPTWGGDGPEDALWAYMRAIDDSDWRADAEHVVVLVTDYPAKLRTSEFVAGHQVAPAGARLISDENDITPAILPYGSAKFYDVGSPTTATVSEIAAALGVSIHHWESADGLKSGLAAAVIPPSVGLRDYYCEARVESIRYASDNAPSADVSVGMAPAGFVIGSGETRQFRATAMASGKPARLGDTTVVEIGYYVDGARISAATQRLVYSVAGYTVTFMDLNGSLLKTETVAHGGAATAPVPPAHPGWTFRGWDKPFDYIVADTVVTALYDYIYYKVVFVDWNGSVLRTQDVPYAGSASAPANPAREGHVFTGWDKPFNNILADTVVTAQYIIRYFLVVFEDWNGAMISFGATPYGGAATAPPDPIRPGLTFTGWNKPFNFVTEDMYVTAQFNVNYYTVDFVDWNGALLKSTDVPYGGSATAPANPERVGWTFTGWDKTFGYITENTTVTAQYAINYYDVVFEDWDGSELKRDSVPYGDPATPPADPARQGYTFIGWDADFSFIDAPLTLKPIYRVVLIPSILRYERSLQGDGGDQLVFTVRIFSLDGALYDIDHEQKVDGPLGGGSQVFRYSLLNEGVYICDYEVSAVWNADGAVTYIDVDVLYADGAAQGDAAE